MTETTETYTWTCNKCNKTIKHEKLNTLQIKRTNHITKKHRNEIQDFNGKTLHYTHTCQECNKKFTSAQQNSKYCSQECSGKAITKIITGDTARKKLRQAIIQLRNNQYTTEEIGNMTGLTKNKVQDFIVESMETNEI